VNILVTGATGFLGQHVLAALRRRCPDAQVWLLLRRAASWHQAPNAPSNPEVRLIEAPLTDDRAVLAATGGHRLTGILHLAATVHHSRQHSADTFRANVDGTASMVRLARAHGARLVFVSTSGTVGCSRSPTAAPDEHAPFCTQVVDRWPYYASKIAAEQLMGEAQKKGDLDGVILRPPVMLGPGDHRFRATSLIVRFLRGRLPFYLSGGMHFVDIRDAATSMVEALVHPAPRAVYHLPGAAMPLKAYFAQLEQISGVRAPRRLLPYPLALAVAYGSGGKFFDPVVIEMGHHFWGLSSRYASELGFAPRAPLTTLQQTVSWLRSSHPALRPDGTG
jgi:dihydroflavonol-4-reductase